MKRGGDSCCDSGKFISESLESSEDASYYSLPNQQKKPPQISESDRMTLRKMSDSNEFFLFEDRLLKEFRVYTLKNMSQKESYISLARSRSVKTQCD